MNFRSEGQNLRFRISRGELDQLCAGEPLSKRTIISEEESFEARIEVNLLPDILRLTYSNNCIILFADQSALEKLRRSLPAREGLSTTQEIEGFEALCLSLDVDIKTQKKRKAQK